MDLPPGIDKRAVESVLPPRDSYQVYVASNVQAEKEHFILIRPQIGIYDGVLQDTAVQPAAFGGTWYPKLFQPGDEQRTVILHFHGGSFLCGTGRESDCGVPASTILKRIPATALFVQYRLVSDPACTPRKPNILVVRRTLYTLGLKVTKPYTQHPKKNEPSNRENAH